MMGGTRGEMGRGRGKEGEECGMWIHLIWRRREEEEEERGYGDVG
jgi:hypothetical protein